MNKFTPIPDSIFDQPDDHFVFESVFCNLLKLFDNKFSPSNEIEEQLDIPECAKVAWYLWHFAMEVSSSGIPDYLLNNCPSGEQMILTHRALKIVGAHELITLLEAAIPLARENWKEYGEFGEYPRHDWFDQFQVNPLWQDLDKISEPSWTLAASPFSLLVGTYLREHRAELQRSSGFTVQSTR